MNYGSKKRRLGPHAEENIFLYFCLFSVASTFVLLLLQRLIAEAYPLDRTSSITAILSVTHALLAYVALLFAGAVVLAFMVFTIRRLHDFGYSGFWALGVAALSALALVSATFSILTLVVQIILVSVPGNRGTNQYGPDPRPANNPDKQLDFS